MSEKHPTIRSVPALTRQKGGVDWLDPGQVVFVDNEVCLIEARLSPATIRVTDVKTRVVSDVGLARVRPLLPDAPHPDTEGISPEERERAAALNRHLQPYLELRAVPMAVTQAIADLFGVSSRQARRYMAAFRKDPRSASMARGKRGRPMGMRLLDAGVERLIHHVINRHYSRREKISKQEVVDRVTALCRRTGLCPPSRDAILSRIRSAEGYALSAKREGAKRARQLWEPRLGSVGETVPLEVVQIDHTKVDLNVLSSDRSAVLGRPWLTLAIDVASRVVVGFYVLMRAPNSVSVSMCLSHAILPKIEHGVDGIDYPVFGHIREVRVDNAKELSGPTLKRGCAEHGISLQWRPVGKAHYGGHIERLNGTLMQMVHGLPGTTFSNVAQRGDYASESKAILTLDEFRQWLTQQICCRYHARVHRGLGVPPLIAWKRYWSDQADVGIYPLVPPDPAMFYVDFLPLAKRTILRGGVHIDNRRCWHEQLTQWMNHDVSVRKDPRDRRTIRVTTPDGVRLEARRIADDARLVAMDAAERTYAEALTARAFDESDSIVARAKRERRLARRSDATGSPPPSSGSGPLSNAVNALTDADIRIALQIPLDVEDDYV